MNRVLACATLFAALVIAAGCNKKTDPAVHPEPDERAGGDDARAAKDEALKRLREIGKAIYNYESTMGQLPAGTVGPKGEFGLSWRVQILPYFGKEEAKLFDQFNFQEPWDSEQNRKLVAKMPKVFESPGKAAPEGKTYLRSFVGETAFIRLPPQGLVPKGKSPPPPFPNLHPGFPVPGRRVTDITDGTRNTLMVAEAAEPVEWTKPDELPFPGFPGQPNALPVPKLGGVFPGGFHALMCDGSPRFFLATLNEETLRAMITVNGGEALDKEVTAILWPPDPTPSVVPENLPDDAARRAAVANYQQIWKGLREHDDQHGYLPAGLLTKEYLPGLSWRVQVLPYIGELELFQQFRRDEPWDSERNKALIEKMPALFASPGKAAEKGHTFVRTTVGPGGIIPTKPGPSGEPKMQFTPGTRPGGPVIGRSIAANMPDGASRTILLVEAGEAVPWTKPDEVLLPTLPVDTSGKGAAPPKDAKLPPLGGVFADGFHAVMADGRVTFYKTGYPPVELAKMFCPNDGFPVEPLGELEKIGYSVPPTSRPTSPK